MTQDPRLPPAPLYFALPPIKGLFAFGAACLLNKPGLYTPRSTETEVSLASHSAQALARLDISDPNPPTYPSLPLPSADAFALAGLLYPDDPGLLMRTLEEEAARFRQAITTLMRRQRLWVYAGNIFTCAFGALLLYTLGTLVFFVLMPKAAEWYLALPFILLLVIGGTMLYFRKFTALAESPSLPRVCVDPTIPLPGRLVSINPSLPLDTPFAPARNPALPASNPAPSLWSLKLWQ